MRQQTSTIAAVFVGVLAVLMIVVVYQSQLNQDPRSQNQLASSGDSTKDGRCGRQGTYDLIKRELFRRAAQVRGSDQKSFDQLAAYSVVRMDAPLLRGHDKEVDSIQCSGSLALDLPPGVASVGGRRTLTADINYALQSAADGTGEVLTLLDADAVIAELATLGRVRQQTEEPLNPVEKPSQAPPVVSSVKPAVPRPASPLVSPPTLKREAEQINRMKPDSDSVNRLKQDFNCRDANTSNDICYLRR